MNNQNKYNLKYHFHSSDIDALEPGHSLPSTCLPTDTFHNGQSVVVLPGGFPLQLSLHILRLDPRLYSGLDRTDKLLFQFRLNVRNDFPDPFPVSILSLFSTSPDLIFDPCKWMSPCIVEPWKPASWAMSLPRHKQGSDYELSGTFCFYLLDEVLKPMAEFPPISRAEWTTLPHDILLTIFRQIPVADRVRSRLVSQYWARFLDNHHLVWKDIQFVQIQNNISRSKELWTWFYRPSYRPNGLAHLGHALDFLISRNAPIQALEVRNYTETLDGSIFGKFPDDFKELPAILSSEKRLQLKAISLGIICQDTEMISSLVMSQPGLERLYLELGPPRLSPSLLSSLSRLRILSLLIRGGLDWDWHQNLFPLLSRLHGLRLCLVHDHDHPFYHTFLEQLSFNLRRVQGVEGFTGGSCHRRILLWGTEDLSPADAAALLLPNHSMKDNYGFYGQVVSHNFVTRSIS